MTLYADSNYSFNPWMRDIQPQMDPDSDLGEVLRADEVIAEIASQVPMPLPAGIQPRYGAMKTEPTIEEVLGVPSVPGLRETDLGQQGYGGPALGKW